MTPGARVQTAIEILDAVIAAARGNGAAADTVIAQEFRARRYAGSKDKRAIRELVYRAIRAFGTIPPSGRAAMLGLGLGDLDILEAFGGGGYGPAAQSADEPIAEPSLMAAWMADAFAPFMTGDELAALMARAPLDLRVNRLKARREEVMAKIGGEALPNLPDALRFAEGFDVTSSPIFAEGLVEVQDAASQWVAQICGVAPEMTVVDLCAGAGGKTLALSSTMGGEGRLIACDTDRARLSRLPERAARAGSQVETRLLNPKREEEALGDLVATADLVLVDAPCSGSGTWRRNPELRWRLTPERLDQVAALQAHVINLGASLVRPGGHLVYAVCSLFSREGTGQIDAFLAQQTGWLAEPLEFPIGRESGKGRMFTPFHDATDGFFVARLKRSC